MQFVKLTWSLKYTKIESRYVRNLKKTCNNEHVIFLHISALINSELKRPCILSLVVDLLKSSAGFLCMFFVYVFLITSRYVRNVIFRYVRNFPKHGVYLCE